MEEPNKITIENHGQKFTAEFNHFDTTVEEVLDAFIGLMVAAGYYLDSIEEYIKERANEE
jgi:hypothetical protein